MDINGKVAVVTGGASGIGQAVTRRIAAAGGKVVIFDLNEEAGQAMVSELGADNCVFARSMLWTRTPQRPVLRLPWAHSARFIST